MDFDEKEMMKWKSNVTANNAWLDATNTNDLEDMIEGEKCVGI